MAEYQMDMSNPASSVMTNSVTRLKCGPLVPTGVLSADW